MPTRRAHTVHLTAPTEALVRRGALLLEDALHTASLPEGSRLLLIRRLDVGRIHPCRSPATLALTIEQQLQHMVPISATDPAAPHAPAVYFADSLEPYTELCQLLAQGQFPTAWYWPAAVPQWRPHQSHPETYRQILLHLAQQPQGVLAIAHLLTDLHHSNTLSPILSTLTPQDATLLLTLSHLPQPPTANRQHPTAKIAPVSPLPRAAAPLSPRLPLLPVLQTWLPTWGMGDVRSHWLTLIALIQANSARLLSPGLPNQVQRLMHQIATEMTLDSLQDEPGTEDRGRKTEDRRQEIDHVSSLIPPAAPPYPPVPDPILSISASSSLPLSTWLPTSYGGFFFTVNLLTRLGFPQFLSTHPDLIESDFPAQLLLALTHRLAISAEDPIHLALFPPFSSREPALRPYESSVPCASPSPSSPFPPSGSPYPWLRLLHRWCRCYLKISLADLVTRPGELRATSTHIDLRFNLNHSDIRLRRAGLDLDPGWVPWLGRVILFHYHGGSSHAL